MTKLEILNASYDCGISDKSIRKINLKYYMYAIIEK